MANKSTKAHKKATAKKIVDESEFSRMDKVLSKAKGSAGLPDDANPLDRIKYALCAELVKYCIENDMTQRELAEQLGVNESRVSEIVRYRIDKLTTDRLISYLGKLNLKYSLKPAA